MRKTAETIGNCRELYFGAPQASAAQVIIAASSLFLCPFLSFYLSILFSQGTGYDASNHLWVFFFSPPPPFFSRCLMFSHTHSILCYMVCSLNPVLLLPHEDVPFRFSIFVECWTENKVSQLEHTFFDNRFHEFCMRSSKQTLCLLLLLLLFSSKKAKFKFVYVA